jgi:hypothetical protein
MENLHDISFHEAAITGITPKGGDIRLSVENALCGGAKANVDVLLRRVQTIARDGKPAESMAMEQSAGEILTLAIQPGAVRLIVDWRDAANHAREKRSYEVTCESVYVNIV